MRSFLDSLYGRLALVLLAALLAGFGTMYVLFQSHTDENRIRHVARAMAVQVRLLEEVLRTHPDFDQHPVGGVVVVSRLPAGDPATTEQTRLFERLQEPLEEELGRKASTHGSNWHQGGLWIALQDVPGAGRWMFFPTPKRPPHIEPWTWGLWVSFLVVLVGGMALLWGVQKPLRRLERTIREVNTIDAPIVETGGPREVRSVAEQFNQMIERLRQYDRDRAVMLAGVAHDLRAPLTRLRLQLELEESPRRAEMTANLNGIESIIDQFLAFAQDGELDRPIRANLALMVEEIVAPYHLNTESIDIPEDETLEADVRPASLRRALNNLLDNALEYGKAPITISCKRVGDQTVIRVADAGPGIPPERIPEALRPFSRLDTTRSGKGHCGLGLAIADRVATAHQGTLSLKPGLPCGLVAELTIPLSRE
jgi:two-component system, OmpR family, osmolarity sensor histidine kinase EnvZ